MSHMSQLFHIHPDNPQPRLIAQAVDYLNKGGVIVYPTDSGCALGCRLEEKNALGTHLPHSPAGRQSQLHPDVPRPVGNFQLLAGRQQRVSPAEKQHAGQLHLYSQGDQNRAASTDE
nr:Histidinol phosphatase of the PHP family protein [Candidatus Pantoea persica]